MTADELYQQAFRSEIAALKPASLCDVGCGAGALLAHAKSLGIAATGVEPDDARAAEGHAVGLDIRPGTAETLPFPDESFDLVTFENALHHVGDINQALAEAMRVARRAIVIVDPWFDLSIPSQRGGDRFERWLKKLDRMAGMVHWDPIPAGEIVAACNGARSVAVRHLLHLTQMSPEAFAHFASRADPHKVAAAYRADQMDAEIAALRAEFDRTGITEAGTLLVTIGK
ncbi:class I SAM-dependent methyltransferase [Dongia deserti]|uniref:class I SAM-dependent methyltransferase n=1 Tax=Dongia deserti TaxID=2268030 RepID=UPI000E65673C|nr:class I SAM-dependent methyltransferase [Dongia deserti]